MTMRNAVVDKSRGSSARRATAALRSVLPVSAEMAVLSEHDGVGEVEVAGLVNVGSDCLCEVSE